MYQVDPAAALAKLTAHLRPAGVVAFLEAWFRVPSGPDGTLKMALTCIVETLRRSGPHVDLGPRLHRVFQAAGLPLPKMRLETAMDPREDSPLYDYVAHAATQLLPKAIEYGLIGAGELDVASLAGLIRAGDGCRRLCNDGFHSRVRLVVQNRLRAAKPRRQAERCACSRL